MSLLEKAYLARKRILIVYKKIFATKLSKQPQTNVTIALQSIINLLSILLLWPGNKNNICLIVATRKKNKAMAILSSGIDIKKKQIKLLPGISERKVTANKFRKNICDFSLLSRFICASPSRWFSRCYLSSTNTAESFRIIDTTRSVYSANTNSRCRIAFCRRARKQFRREL